MKCFKLCLIVGVLYVTNPVFSQENTDLQKGIMAFSNGDYIAAQYHLKKAVESTTGAEKYESYLYLGASFLLNGNEAQAQKIFKKAIQQNPRQVPDDFPLPSQVIQAYRTLWETYPVINDLTFTDFNPYQYQRDVVTIQPHILHRNFLKTIELTITHRGEDIATLHGIDAIRHWNGMYNDQHVSSGWYQFTFHLKTTRGEDLTQQWQVHLSATSPYGSEFQEYEQVTGLKDKGSEVATYVWLGSMIFTAGTALSSGASFAQAVAQGCLLGSLLGYPLAYIAGAIVGVGDAVHNSKIRKQIAEKNRQIEKRNQKIMETLVIHMEAKP